MALGGVIRILFFAIVCFLCCWLRRHKKIVRDNRIFVTISFVLVAVYMIMAYLPVEDAFVTFNSMESSFHYSNNGEIICSVMGENSDFIFSKSNEYNISVIPRTDKGWKMTRTLRTIKYRMYGTITLNVYYCRQSDDYYIMLTDMAGKPFEVSDDRGSEFSYYTESIDVNNTEKHIYYSFAYISDFDEQYTLIINDKKVVLENCEGLK